MSAQRWSVKVVWLDGEEELLMHGDSVAVFSRGRAEWWRDFMLEGVADEVQSINVVPAPVRRRAAGAPHPSALGDGSAGS